LWCINSGTFYVVETVIGIQYLVAAIINLMMFGPFRYAINRLYIFKA